MLGRKDGDTQCVALDSTVWCWEGRARTACACRIARRPERERVIDDWESLCWSVVGLGLCHWVGNLKTAMWL